MRVAVFDPSESIIAYADHHGITISDAARELIGVGLQHAAMPKKGLPVETPILGFAKDGEVRR